MTEIEIKKSSLYFFGVIAIVVVLGFFMLKNTGSSSGNSIVDEVGDGEIQKVVIGMKDYNYYPNTVRVKAGSPVSISLDETVRGCFRDFTIREFGIHEYLKNTEDTVEFTPTKPGKYKFACSMGMGTGTLIVE